MADNSSSNSNSLENTSNKSKTKNALQTNLFAFFSSSVPVPPKKRKAAQVATLTESGDSHKKKTTQGDDENDTINTVKNPSAKDEANNSSGKEEKQATALNNNDINKNSTDPIQPTIVPTPRNVMWQSLHDDHVIFRRPTNEEPRSKVAALDLDGTLVVWNSPSWPNQLSHYELWNASIPQKLQSWYDQGYKLLIISNQGSIQKAHHGKKATLVRNVIDWIATLVDRPIYAVISTRSPKKVGDQSFHKPSPKLWQVATQYGNQRQEFDLSQSFFVGDSADPNDSQGGVDAKFAQAVSQMMCQGTLSSPTTESTPPPPPPTLPFFTPTDYFGPSHADRRKKERALAQGIQAPPPPQALRARSALLGGYSKYPIMLLLCGVQGSGKSTFCNLLLQSDDSHKQSHWIVLSQDTINNGRPGRRELVEERALDALINGKSVVVDRMHLDPLQRNYFVQVANTAGVPVHILVFNPPASVISERVTNRTNHPGKVQGPEGARIALQSMSAMELPIYSEAFELITSASSPAAVERVANIYRRVGDTLNKSYSPKSPRSFPLSNETLQLNNLPSILLGTMKLGKKVTKETIVRAPTHGICGVDTALSYKNMEPIGEALSELKEDMFVTAKIPIGVIHGHQVREELEKSLSALQRSSVELLLLHWPHAVIHEGTLAEVWKEMEACCNEGLCKALGVCNFNATALTQLLANCTIPPSVNQVERHPLLPQMDLVDFCSQNNILVQAHSPLGQGKEDLLANSVITGIAKETNLSAAQVVMRWHMQQGLPVVVKCQKEDHMREIGSVQDSMALTPQQMERLDQIVERKRFVAPPWMYGTAPYCWEERIPPKKVQA